MQSFKQMETIFNKLADDESKRIFIKRLEFSLTKDKKYLDEMIKELMELYQDTDPITELIAWIKSHNNKKLIIFGAGFAGYEIVEALNLFDIKPECFCDNNQNIQGSIRYGLPIVSTEYLRKSYYNACIVVASNLYGKDIYEQLVDLGFSENNIYYSKNEWWLGNQKQYFDHKIILPSDGESFIDGGAYDGETTADFIHWCHSNYDAVYAFEPDEFNARQSKQLFERKGFNKCYLYNEGLYDEMTKLHFDNGKYAASMISDMGETVVQTRTIDNILNGKPITYIKMDIEGAELAALHGAEETIRRYAPRLGICVYHKPEDIIEIPAYIYKLHPEYRFYLRHYSYVFTETVLYAIDN